MELSDKSAAAKPVNEDSIPGHLKCHACSGLLINCYQTLHGCRLCQKCVIGRLQPSKRRVCPCTADFGRDEDEINRLLVNQESSQPDLATRRDVSNLMAHCPNQARGCQRRLQFGQVDSHLAGECEFETLVCDACRKEVPRHRLATSHGNLRADDCCAEYSGQCPLCWDSSLRLTRESFLKHLEACPEKAMKCMFKLFGCEIEGTSSQLGEHCKSCMGEHLAQTAQYLLDNATGDKIRELERRQKEQDERQDKLDKWQKNLEDMQLKLHTRLEMLERNTKLHSDGERKTPNDLQNVSRRMANAGMPSEMENPLPELDKFEQYSKASSRVHIGGRRGSIW